MNVIMFGLTEEIKMGFLRFGEWVFLLDFFGQKASKRLVFATLTPMYYIGIVHHWLSDNMCLYMQKC